VRWRETYALLFEVLRPGPYGLLLHTLFHADEVRTQDEFRTEVAGVSPYELAWRICWLKH